MSRKQDHNLLPRNNSLASTADDSLTTSTAESITLQSATIICRVDAIDAGIFCRFDGTASSTTFDFYVPAGQGRDLPTPPASTALSLIADGATAKYRVTEHGETV